MKELTARIAKWRKNNPQKHRAHRIVFTEIRAGRLIQKPCWCGILKSEAHHEDYSKPLDIVWLCKKHHALADRKLRPNYESLSKRNELILKARNKGLLMREIAKQFHMSPQLVSRIILREKLYT